MVRGRPPDTLARPGKSRVHWVRGTRGLHQRLSRLRSFQTMGQVPSGNAPGRGLNKDKDNKVCQKAELLTLPEERGV